MMESQVAYQLADHIGTVHVLAFSLFLKKKKNSSHSFIMLYENLYFNCCIFY